jgi:hypothetical protein
MQIELGNHASIQKGLDDRPKLTSIHIPEFDDGAGHPEGTPLGGYTHKIGAISPAEFKDHLAEAIINRGGITQLPDHEALLAITQGWPTQGREKPKWVNVIDHELTPDGQSADIKAFLSEFWGIPTAEEYFNASDPEELLVKKELAYWTQTEPGVVPGGLSLPDAKALFTNTGRVQQANNYGGGQVGAVGTGTAATATSLTTPGSYATNQWAGYRVYAYNGTNIVWGNVLSNTATVLTIDRWYNPASPGGSAAATPSGGYYYVIADGGSVSSWFVGLTSTNITPAATDTTQSGEYSVAAGGYYRKIAPFTMTSGTSPMTYTLVPVFTGNGSDTYPTTFYAMGAFCSMVIGSTPAMKFETSLNASATVAASGDQITITETVTGS